MFRRIQTQPHDDLRFPDPRRVGPEQTSRPRRGFDLSFQSFKTERPDEQDNFAGLTRINHGLLGRVEAVASSQRLVLDKDSTKVPLYGEHEASADNRRFQTSGSQPLVLFDRQGDRLAGKLRPGGVPSAEGWEQVLLPETEWQQRQGRQVVFPAEAAFAKPELYEAPGERGVNCATRTPCSDSLERNIGERLTRPVRRPARKPLVRHKGFLSQAASWTKARRVGAKVEFPLGKLFPRVGFIVTHLETDRRAVVRFHSQRGTAEQ